MKRARRRMTLGASRVKVIGIAAVIAVGGASLARSHPVKSGAPANAAVVASVDPMSIAMVAAPSRGPRPGDVETYDLSLVSDLSLSLEAVARRNSKPSRAATMRTEGRLVERTLQVTAEGTVALLVVDGARVTTEGKPEGAKAAALASGLVVLRDDRGTIRRVRFPVDFDRDQRGTTLALTDVMQWVAPRGDEATWSASEPSTVGTREVRYERESADGGGMLRFTRRIDRVSSSATVRGTTNEQRGAMRGTLDVARGALADASGEITSEQRMDTGGVFARAVLTVSLHRVGTDRDLARASALSASLETSFGPWTSLDAPLPPSKADEARSLERMTNGYSDVDLDRLLDRAGQDPEAHRKLVESLWAYLRIHPGACAHYAERAARGALADATTRLILQALVRAEHPDAQRALTDIGKAWKGREAAGSVAAALAAIAAPTPETVTALREMRDDPSTAPSVAGRMDVALGNMAEHLRESDPARADAIAAALTDQLRSTDDPPFIASSLAALGNARSERAAEVAPAYLENDDPLVRKMAAFAIGRAAGDGARALLQHVAESDLDPDVRREASDALETLHD